MIRTVHQSGNKINIQWSAVYGGYKIKLKNSSLQYQIDSFNEGFGISVNMNSKIHMKYNTVLSIGGSQWWNKFLIHTWALRNRRAEISANVTPPTKTTSTRERLPSPTLKCVQLFYTNWAKQFKQRCEQNNWWDYFSHT